MTNISQRFYDSRKETTQKDTRPPYRRPAGPRSSWRRKLWRTLLDTAQQHIGKHPAMRAYRMYEKQQQHMGLVVWDPQYDYNRRINEWLRGEFTEAYDWAQSSLWARVGIDTAPRFEFAPADMDGWEECANNVGVSGSECGVHMQTYFGSICGNIPIGGQAMNAGSKFDSLGNVTSGDGMIPAGTRYVVAGTIHNLFAPCNRYRPEVQYSRAAATTAPQRFGRNIPGRMYRLPIPLGIPPAPVITETDTPPPGTDRPPPLQPYEEPMIEAIVDPGGGINMRGGAHIRMPPKPNEREKKDKTSGSRALALIGALYDGATEAAEIVDILYDNLSVALPWRPGRGYNMSEKANFVWSNLDKLDIQGSITGILANHYEDKIWGRIYGTVGKHTGYGSMGPNHGGWGADLGKITPI